LATGLFRGHAPIDTLARSRATKQDKTLWLLSGLLPKGSRGTQNCIAIRRGEFLDEEYPKQQQRFISGHNVSRRKTRFIAAQNWNIFFYFRPSSGLILFFWRRLWVLFQPEDVDGFTFWQRFI